MIVHDFDTCLRLSHAASDLPMWEEIYRKAFKNFMGMADFREDGEWQRKGIDRMVILSDTRVLKIDEKVREQVYSTPPDVLLEYVSNDVRNTPGWVCKELFADYIAYAIKPIGEAYLLPVVQLQQAFAANREQWIRRYKRVEAYNPTYTTIGVAVPRDVLFKAIGQELRVSFTPPPETHQQCATE